MPIMKIGLDDKTHRQFKVWCAANGETMSGAVVGLIGKVLGESWGKVPGGGKPENAVRLGRDNAGSSPAPGPKAGYEDGKKCRECGEPLRNVDAHFKCAKCREKL